MKVNENTIYIFLLGILAGIICMQCVNHFRKSPKDVYVDNFEYEKESLGILKREELKNEHYECLDQIAYWGTDSLDSFSLSNLCNDKKLFFCFSEKTCPPCIDAVVDIMNEVFTDEEIKTKGNYIRLCTISKIIKGHMIMYPFIIQSFFSFFFPFPSFLTLQERVFRKRGSRGSVFGL